MIKKLISLSSLGGISGFEFSIADDIISIINPYFDEVTADKMGNIAAIKKCGKKNAKTVMLEAHTDGIGLMVKDIDKKGFITFVPIGGIDTKTLLCAEVIVCGTKELYGVIGAKPPHLQTAADMEKTIPIKDLAIDVGLSQSEVKAIVSVGDMIYFKNGAKQMLEKTVSGKYLDDRAGVISLLVCMDKLKNVKFDFDICVHLSVQEEVGLRGAVFGTYNVEPDCAFVVDVTHGTTPDVSTDLAFELGSGTVISVGPNIHPYLAELAQSTAKNESIMYSVDAEGGDTGTDAWEVQVSRFGVPVLLLSVPLRYMHTSVETLDYNDVVATGRLLAGMLQNIDLEELKCTF